MLCMKYLFYKPIKFSSSSENFAFWSDTHFFHACNHWPVPLWKARGFSSIEEHNELLIERWNSKCTHETVFFHLGDFIFGLDAKNNFKDIIRKVNFKTLYIMPGNHYSGWKQVFEEQRSNVWDVTPEKRVIFVPNYLEAIINGQLFVMSHYPILSFNGQSKNAICLYGHVHGNLSKHAIGSLYSQARTYEVTVENCKDPLMLNDINQLFAQSSPITFDSHLQT
jgi:calcineurin-like phosphoesterase family protein